MLLIPERFKVNGLIVPVRGSDHFVYALNFNLPAEDLENPDRANELLESVQTCIEDEFPTEIGIGEVYFRITASYILTHVATKEPRLWQGSFQPRTTQEHNILSNRLFSPDTFGRTAGEAVSPERVVRKLKLGNENSNWIFNKLRSVIISFQAKCKYNTHIFRQGSLFIPNTGIIKARQRRSTTFEKYLD